MSSLPILNSSIKETDKIKVKETKIKNKVKNKNNFVKYSHFKCEKPTNGIKTPSTSRQRNHLSSRPPPRTQRVKHKKKNKINLGHLPQSIPRNLPDRPAPELRLPLLNFLPEDIRKEIKSSCNQFYKKKKFLDFILNYNHGENKFMPSKKQILYLEKYNEYFPNISNDMDPKNWLKLNLNLLFNPFSEGVKNDQETRASIILSYMDKHKIKNLITMDGHGRFTGMIMSKILEKLKHKYKNKKEKIKEELSKYKIYLIDIDENVTLWHKAYLPSNFVNTLPTGSVFDLSDDLINSSMVYLNFCGVGNQMKNLKRFVLKMIKSSRPLFLSYSVRAIRPNTTSGIISSWLTDNKRKTDNNSPPFKTSLMSERGLFKSYVIEPLKKVEKLIPKPSLNNNEAPRFIIPKRKREINQDLHFGPPTLKK